MHQKTESSDECTGGDRRAFMVQAVALGAAVTLSLPAASAVPATRRGGVLRVSVAQAVAKVNPFQARVLPEYLVADLFYSSLVRLNETNVPEPDLALSWSSNAALDEWVFKLRPSVKFHDGSPCTEKDVIASLKAVLDPKTGSPGRQNVGPIAEIVSTAPNTVTFRLSAGYADFPTAMASSNAKIVPAAILQGGMDRLSREAVGTGPFKLTTFESDRIIVGVRNDNYYDPIRPHVDRVEVHVYPDATSEGSALIAGDIDLMAQVLPTEYERLSTSAGIKALRQPSGQFCNVIMGCDQKPFNDIRVRRALALSIDRKAMVDFIAEGYGTVANDTPVNTTYPYYSKQPDKGRDLAQAKKLLVEAGHSSGLNLTLIASDVPAVRTQLGVALREAAKPAGFNIEVQTMPQATYLDQVWRKGSFYVGFYNTQPTIDALFSLLYTSNAAWNETHWNNKEFDALVLKARATADPAQRQQLYAAAQMLMRDEVPSVVPVFFDLLRAHRDHVQNFRIHPRGVIYRLDYVALSDRAPKRA